MNTQPQAPLSPWAQRFGTSAEAYWLTRPDRLRHSGLAPKFPDLDPVYYSNHPSSSNDQLEEIAKPSSKELDELFHGECLQQYILKGVKTWQFGGINQSVYPNRSGGHAVGDPEGSIPSKHYGGPDLLDQDRIVPDESTWFDCFKKNRWLIPKDGAPQAPKLTNWSVDNDVIWNHIGISLELANRVFSRLILEKNPWLDAVLHPKECMQHAVAGRNGYYFVPGTGGVVDQNTRLGLRFRSPGARADPAALRKRFETLTKNFLWTFYDEFDADISPSNSDVLGVTQKYVTDKNKIDGTVPVCQVNIALLRALCCGSLTLAERYMAWHQLAVTILHETIHGIWFQGNWDINCHVNAFMQGEYIAEMGLSFENIVFGGVLHPTFELGRNGFWYQGISLGSCMEEFPNPFMAQWMAQTWGQRGPYDILEGAIPTLRQNQTRNIYHAPVYWTSMLLTENFWSSVVPIQGSQAFRFPKQLCTKQQWIQGTYIRFFSLQTMKPDDKGDERTDAKLKNIFREFDVYEQKFNSIRPWFDTEFDKWQLSAWGATFARSMINNFRFYHAKRDFPRAFNFSRSLLDATKDYFNPSVTHDGPEPRMFWIFGVIAFLMCASLPVRYVARANGRVTYRELRLGSEGKKTAPNFPGSLSFPLLIPRRESDRSAITPELENPARYSHIAANEIQYYESVPYPAPEEWIIRIKKALKDITTDRYYTNYIPGRWARFRFNVPDYNPDSSWVTLVNAAELTKPYKDQRYTSVTIPPLKLQGFHPNSPGHLPPYYDEAMTYTTSCSSGGGKVARRFRNIKDGNLSMGLDEPTKYFTIAGVADAGPFHIVEPNVDGSLDIYDIKDTVADVSTRTSYSVRECLDGLTYGINGRQLDDSAVSQNIRRMIGLDPRPVGKLLQWLRLTEVGECDGTNGKPLFVTLRGHVFNISDFPFADDEKSFFTKNPGGPIHIGIDQRKSVYDIFQRLLPYRCALVMPVSRTPPEEESLPPYTLNQLRWHDNPTDGIYIAIGGMVYDITGYVDYHPAGFNIIKKVTGRDATPEFAKYHSQGLLNETDYAALKIGRIVPEIVIEDLGGHQIILHEWVFDVTKLQNQDTALYSTAQRFRGTDATPWLTGKFSDEVSTELAKIYLEHEQAIVAKLREDITVPDVSLSDLMQKKNADRNGGAWAAVGSDVYDVTTVIRHRDCYDGAPVLNTRMAGTILKFAPTMTWLQEEQRHRVVARLKTDVNTSTSTNANRKRKYSE